MNSVIEGLYKSIAMEIYAIRPDAEWVDATYRLACITNMMEGSCIFLMKDGSKDSAVPSLRSRKQFIELRNEMGKLHENGHVWYTARCKLTADGKFKFEFDYDHLPAFDIIPDPADWLDEFKQHPRPSLQLKIQDWIDGQADPEIIVKRLNELQLDK